MMHLGTLFHVGMMCMGSSFAPPVYSGCLVMHIKDYQGMTVFESYLKPRLLAVPTYNSKGIS